MTNEQPKTDHITYARQRRKDKTTSEGLLWSILRAKQVCGLKFRREHPIGPYTTDFACVSHHLVVEVDGGYHDETVEADLRRQAFLQSQGWKVVRFTDEEIEHDAEAAGLAVAKALGLEYSFEKRNARGSGMSNVSAKKPKTKPR